MEFKWGLQKNRTNKICNWFSKICKKKSQNSFRGMKKQHSKGDELSFAFNSNEKGRSFDKPKLLQFSKLELAKLHAYGSYYDILQQHTTFSIGKTFWYYNTWTMILF